MKRFVTTAMGMSLLFTACSSTALSIVKPEVTYAADSSSQQTDLIDLLLSPEEYQALQESEAARIAAEQHDRKIARLEQKNASKMKKVLTRLERTVGRTWYAFSGSTPAGWDCSGLVAWTYKQMGVRLPHSAAAQSVRGHFVNDPVPGDIVAYYYRGYSVASHTGIYIGDGKVIHALKPGTVTRVESAEDGVVSWSMYPRYVRIIPLTEPLERIERQGSSVPVSVIGTAS
jgi:cell wall-associated NlpC family hydrolase